MNPSAAPTAMPARPAVTDVIAVPAVAIPNLTTTVQDWDAAAPGWHDSSDAVRTWLRAATAALLDAAALVPGARVLDVAAGAGDQTLDIARRVGAHGQVLATDVSPQMLALASTALRRAGVHNVQCQVRDAQALGLAGAGFDAAICRLGLMLCPQPARALQSLHAALRPGARLAVLVFDGPAGNPCVSTLARVTQRITQRFAQRHAGRPVADVADPFVPGSLLSLGRPGLLAQLLQDSGFDEVRIESIEAPFRLPSVQHYVQFLRSAAAPVMALLQPLPAAVQHAAWQEIAAELGVFSTADGWCGPNRLLLAAGRAASTQPQRNSR